MNVIVGKQQTNIINTVTILLRSIAADSYRHAVRLSLYGILFKDFYV